MRSGRAGLWVASTLALLSSLGCPQAPAKTAPAARPSPPTTPAASPVATRAEGPSVPRESLAPGESSAPGDSPEAPAAEATPAVASDGLAGTWSGRRIRLELVAEGEGYAGTLTLRRRELPVAVQRGSGGWGGVLVQGEREAAFSLRREGEALVMTSDGRSYRLSASAEAPAWAGSYRGPREARLALAEAGQACSGSLDLEGVRYVVRGRPEEGGLAGSLRDPLTGKELTWRASEVSSEGLLFTIRLEEQDAEGRASFHALRFERGE